MKKFVISAASLQTVICAVVVIFALPFTGCGKNSPTVPDPDSVPLPEVVAWSNSGNLSWTFEDAYSDCFINFRYCNLAIGDTVYSAITGEPMIINGIIE